MTVFISYRRDNGEPVAEKIYQALSKDYDVFLDQESLKSGYFDTAIVKSIETCTDFIMIVTDTIFDRCPEPGDWIAKEVQIALSEHKNIIPVFVGTKGFPKNVPEDVSEICRLNGIFWLTAEESCAKIKSFLHSNKRCVLSVISREDGAKLDDNSREELKELYRKFVKLGREPVEVTIQVEDIEGLSRAWVRKDALEEHGEEFAARLAKQYLFEKIDQRSEALRFAIEFLLQDKMVDSCALRLSRSFESRYGISECVFEDERGAQYFYWTPFLWIDIIEELLKEFVLGRYDFYANSCDYIDIDCFINAHNGDYLWSFISYIPKEAVDETHVALIETLRIPGGRADYFDIPPSILASHTFPDFFYNIGHLKANNTRIPFESFNKHKEVFNLINYNFGLH